MNEKMPFGIAFDFGGCFIAGANKLTKKLYGRISNNQNKNKYKQYFNDYLGIEYKFNEYAGSIIP